MSFHAGLEILAFPCNQFGGQEPGSNEQIVEFACTRFKAEYPIFDKVNRNIPFGGWVPWPVDLILALVWAVHKKLLKTGQRPEIGKNREKKKMSCIPEVENGSSSDVCLPLVFLTPIFLYDRSAIHWWVITIYKDRRRALLALSLIPPALILGGRERPERRSPLQVLEVQ